MRHQQLDFGAWVLKRISAGSLSLHPPSLSGFGNPLPGCSRKSALTSPSAVTDFWARRASTVRGFARTSRPLKRRDCAIEAIALLFHLSKDAVYIHTDSGLYIGAATKMSQSAVDERRTKATIIASPLESQMQPNSMGTSTALFATT